MESNENEYKRNELLSIITDIKNANPSHNNVNEALIIMKKLLDNIRAYPRELKYRKLKTTNQNIQKSLLTVTGIYELIESIGYVQVNAEMYELEDHSLKNVEIAFQVIAQAITVNSTVGTTNKEQVHNGQSEDVVKEKEKIQKKIEDEKKARQEILELIEQDKADRALKQKFTKTQDSISMLKARKIESKGMYDGKGFHVSKNAVGVKVGGNDKGDGRGMKVVRKGEVKYPEMKVKNNSINTNNNKKQQQQPQQQQQRGKKSSQKGIVHTINGSVNIRHNK